MARYTMTVEFEATDDADAVHEARNRLNNVHYKLEPTVFPVDLGPPRQLTDKELDLLTHTAARILSSDAYMSMSLSLAVTTAWRLVLACLDLSQRLGEGKAGRTC